MVYKHIKKLKASILHLLNKVFKGDVGLLLFIVMVVLVACDDDDFAPYTSYEEQLDMSIDRYPYTIDDIVNEVSVIAQSYEEEAILTNAIIVLKGLDQLESGKGIILFDYYKEHETKNQVTKILLTYNMSTGKVDKLNFKQGHGKRISGYINPIDKELSKSSISQLLSDFYSDTEFQEKISLINPRLEIDYTNELFILLYDDSKNEGPVYRKKLSIIIIF